MALTAAQTAFLAADKKLRSTAFTTADALLKAQEAYFAALKAVMQEFPPQVAPL